MISQILFMSSRSRIYIHTYVVFLTTCVNNADEYGWVKLNGVLKYLKEAKHMKLILSVDSMYMVRW